MKVVTTEVCVSTERRHQFIDLTDELKAAVKDSAVVDGAATAFCAHTTCSLIINEWEDGTMEDLCRRLESVVPDGVYYAHDDRTRRTQNLVSEERVNGRAHVVQMLLGGTTQTVPVAGGDLLLGQWQRLILFELDEPKDRTVVFQVGGI